MLDESGRRERREQARDGAGVDPGAARDLVGAELLPVRERVDYRQGAPDGSDMADGWFTGTGRGTLPLLILTRRCPGGNYT